MRIIATLLKISLGVIAVIVVVLALAALWYADNIPEARARDEFRRETPISPNPAGG